MTREDQYNFTLSSGKIVAVISGALCAMLACFVAGLVIGRSSEPEAYTPTSAAVPAPVGAGKAESAKVNVPEIPKRAERRAGTRSPARRPAVARQVAPQPSSTAAPAASPVYTICVLSARQRDGAERYATELRGQGYKASVKRTQLRSGKVWYRTVIGAFADRKIAEQQLAELKKKGKFADAFVTLK